MTECTTAISRRRLIGQAAAIAAPMIIPRSALGGKGYTPPSERITVAFIGCGKMANEVHLPTLLALSDVEALAVCDVDANRRAYAKKRVQETYSKGGRSSTCDSYSPFRKVLARTDIDAVLIATPEHWHAIPLIEACKSGKDVYCEKPLTLTLAEGKRCIDAARKYGRVVQTGSQQRSNVYGNFREAVEIIQSGRLGKIKSVTVGAGRPSQWCKLPGEAKETGLDWDLWLGPAPIRPYSSVLSPRGVHNHYPAWRNYREYAGGGHTDTGAHFYDIAQWALGMDRSGPVKIIPPQNPNESERVKFIYANGIEVIHRDTTGCYFTGTRGTLHIDRHVLIGDPPEVVEQPLGDKDVHLYRSPGHHRNWIDCIKSRKRPVADVEIGARSVAVAQLGNLAYWTRKTLEWDPSKWRFVGPGADQKLLDHERRAPWKLPDI
jgi:predicted dehydrogenase